MSLVNLSKENAVAVIELDRKDKRNALSSALRDEIEGENRDGRVNAAGTR